MARSRFQTCDDCLVQPGEVVRERWEKVELTVVSVELGPMDRMILSDGRTVKGYLMWMWDIVSRPQIQITHAESGMGWAGV